MGPGRRFGGWTTVGALAGYFVSFLWLLFLVVRPDGLSAIGRLGTSSLFWSLYSPCTLAQDFASWASLSASAAAWLVRGSPRGFGCGRGRRFSRL